jgi:DNA-binding LacI/PurR family transcriptional regulator
VQIYRLHEYSVPFPIVGAVLFDINDREFLSFFEKKKIPYVVVNGICLGNGSAVQVDEEADAALLIEHLAANGHRKIAYYAAHADQGTPGQHYSGILRQEGIDRELRRRGLPMPQGDGDAVHSPKMFLRQHVLRNGVTAVVCYDHVRVQQIVQAAWELGLKVPEQFSVVSFDNAECLELLAPPVTCCDFSSYELGMQGARLLLKRLNGDLSMNGEILRIPENSFHAGASLRQPRLISQGNHAAYAKCRKTGGSP